MEEEFKLPNKLLEREETFPANALRELSQKSLMEKVSNYEKLGLIVNNQLSIAMLSWENYEKLIDLIENQNDRIAKLENALEDIQLVQMYGKGILDAEKNGSKSFEVDTVEDLFKLLD